MKISVHLLLAAWLVGTLAAGSACAVAATAPAPPRGKEEAPLPIYTCVDAQGRRLSSDRPIPECLSQEQQLRRSDGSSKAVVPPLLSPEEKARQDAVRLKAAQAKLAREAEARRDRTLISRYPDRAHHEDARAKAQEPVTRQIEAARQRLAELEIETQGIAAERDTLQGKPMPPSLRARVATNEGAIEAQKTILRDQQAERERLTEQFDAELGRLKLLWGTPATAPSAGPMISPSAMPTITSRPAAASAAASAGSTP
jgi:hypothetical protein